MSTMKQWAVREGYSGKADSSGRRCQVMGDRSNSQPGFNVPPQSEMDFRAVWFNGQRCFL